MSKDTYSIIWILVEWENILFLIFTMIITLNLYLPKWNWKISGCLNIAIVIELSLNNKVIDFGKEKRCLKGATAGTWATPRRLCKVKTGEVGGHRSGKVCKTWLRIESSSKKQRLLPIDYGMRGVNFSVRTLLVGLHADT